MRKCDIDGCEEKFPAKGTRKYCDFHKPRAQSIRNKLERETMFEAPRTFQEVTVAKADEGTRIIIVNDLQRPFHDQVTLTAIEAFWDDFKPHVEVFNGDIADFYEVSKFDRNPSRRFHLQDELDDSHSWLEQRANKNPGARKVFIEGNHEDRLRRWLWRYGKDLALLRSLEVPQLLGLKELGFGYLPYKSVLDFLGYRIEHGYKTSASKAYPVNVSRYMAIATGSSGLCGHTHRFSIYAWADASGSHSYIENGCLCRFDLEYAPFPNWQQSFTYGIVHKNKVHLVPVQVYSDGFRAEGQFYPRR